MSYTTGEADVLTRLRACTGFDSTNTSRGDWGILNSGKSDHYGIIRMGEFNHRWMSSNMYQAQWTTIIEIWQRYTDDTATRTNLYGYLANVVSGLLTYRYLGDSATVEDANIDSGDEPQRAWEKDGGPMWLFITVRVRWDETSTVSFAE